MECDIRYTIFVPSFNLSFDGVFKTPSFDVKTIKKRNKIMHCVALFLSGRYGHFYVFIYLSVMGRYNPPSPIKIKLKYVKMPISSKLQTF